MLRLRLGFIVIPSLSAPTTALKIDLVKVMSTRMLYCVLTVHGYPKIFKMTIVSLVHHMSSLFVLLSLKRQHPMPKAHQFIAIVMWT
jgi:hypothetical protein